MSMNLKKLLAAVEFLLLLCSCSLKNEIKNPPYAVSNPVLEDGTGTNGCNVGGLFFDYYNKKQINVVKLEVKFCIYDKETKLSVIKKGQISATLNSEIAGGEKRKLCIPLDSYITTFNKDRYIVDQFFVSRIEFSDGSTWEDVLGIYAINNGD